MAVRNVGPCHFGQGQNQNERRTGSLAPLARRSRPFGCGGLGTNARPSGRLGRLFRNYLFIFPCRHVCRSLALPRKNKRGGNGGDNHKRGNGCGDFAQSRFGKRSDRVTGCDNEQPGDGNANRGSGIDISPMHAPIASIQRGIFARRVTFAPS